jgi:methionine-gamma-lyase
MKEISFDSLCARVPDEEITTQPHQLPLHLSSTFRFQDAQESIDIFTKKKKGDVYSRFGNPTIRAVAEKIAAMEAYDLSYPAYGLMSSSGMGAISTVFLATLQSGDKIVTLPNLYGGTMELLQVFVSRSGVEIIFDTLDDAEGLEEILKSNPEVKMIYFETPTNPTLHCVDIQTIATLAKKYSALSCIDNTFATPYLQRPLNKGIDIIVHSTTKYLNGQGTGIAGAIVGTDYDLIHKQIWTAQKLNGATCNPFDAWLVHLGLRTLTLRMQRHCDNAMNIAQFLEDHNKVKVVNYPGLESHPSHIAAQRQMLLPGAMLSFELADLEAGKRFMDKIRFCTLAPSLGDADSLILHPASSSHINVPKLQREESGITDGLIRLSVGLEDTEDIMEDLATALKSI